jgi:hypothetical protein
MATRRRTVALLASVLASTILLPSPVIAGSSDLLPDLEMAPIFQVELRTSANGHKHLRFGTIVYNVGDGPLEVRARNASAGQMHRVVQAIKQGDGSWRKVVKSDAKVFYAGDGHDHWHIARFNRAELTAVNGTPPADRRLRKIGFCLVDSLVMPDPPPDTPPQAYFGCGVRQSPTVKMGISMDWGDIYGPTTKFQEIDVTGLPPGKYRLCTTTNPKGVWTEKGNNVANNSSWMKLEIDLESDHLEPVAHGQTPC